MISSAEIYQLIGERDILEDHAARFGGMIDNELPGDRTKLEPSGSLNRA